MASLGEEIYEDLLVAEDYHEKQAKRFNDDLERMIERLKEKYGEDFTLSMLLLWADGIVEMKKSVE